MEVGHRIREIRKRAGITMKQLGEMVGVSACFTADPESIREYSSTGSATLVCGDGELKAGR